MDQCLIDMARIKYLLDYLIESMIKYGYFNGLLYPAFDLELFDHFRFDF